MLTVVSRRELIRKFRALGFEGPLSGIKHQFMKRGSFKLHIPNPHQADISIGLLKHLLRLAQIDEAAWDRA